MIVYFGITLYQNGRQTVAELMMAYQTRLILFAIVFI